MKNNFEMALRISSDLMTYCHHHGAKEHGTKITEGDESIQYVISGYPVDITDEQYEDIVKKLHAPRQRDVENDFWELIGESEDFSEMMLVGMSCDEVEISYVDRKLTFTLLRYY